MGISSFITLTNVNDGSKGEQGLPGQYLAFQFYSSTSDTTQVGGEWSTTMPSIAGGRFLWMRTQLVPAGETVLNSRWSQPTLAGTDISRLMSSISTIDKRSTQNASAILANSKQIETKVSQTEFDGIKASVESNTSSITQTAQKIALVVNNGKVYPAGKETNAAFEVGTIDGQGYILLDAGRIIASGTVTAREIDVGSLAADKAFLQKIASKEIVLNSGGIIESDGYGTGDKGFSISSSGDATFVSMKAVGGFFDNITITGNSTFTGDINTNVFKVLTKSVPQLPLSADSSRDGLERSYVYEPEVYQKLNALFPFDTSIQGTTKPNDYTVTHNVRGKGYYETWYNGNHEILEISNRHIVYSDKTPCYEMEFTVVDGTWGSELTYTHYDSHTERAPGEFIGKPNFHLGSKCNPDSFKGYGRFRGFFQNGVRVDKGVFNFDSRPVFTYSTVEKENIPVSRSLTVTMISITQRETVLYAREINKPLVLSSMYFDSYSFSGNPVPLSEGVYASVLTNEDNGKSRLWGAVAN